MSDVKLSRRALERTVELVDREGWYPSPAQTDELIAATRALLAVMEPASDEEISDYVRTLQDFEKLSTQAWRAAEARARRLANFQEDE